MKSLEEWCPCPGHNGLYEVSSLGRVRSLYFDPPRISKQGVDSKGYPIIMLTKEGKRRPLTVHRLIALAFHADKRNALHNEVAHLDGDRANASASNLKWVSKVENRSHQIAHGTAFVGEKHPRAKLTADQVLTIRAMRGTHRGIAEIFGISRYTVEDIRSRRRWKHLPAGRRHRPNTIRQGEEEI